MVETYLHGLEITTPEGEERRFKLPLGITTLGRQAGNDLVLDHQQVSRRHAQLICTNQECEISDQGSSNGSYVNGEKLTPEVPRILADGDEIKVGGFQMVYRRTPVPEKKAEDAPPPEEAEEAPAKAPPEQPEDQVPAADIEDKPEPDLPEPAEIEEKAEPPAEPAAKKKKTPKDKKPAREKAPKTPEEAPPPAVPPSPPPPEPTPAGLPAMFPPGLELHSRKLIDFLPGIYHTDLVSRFLGLIESILIPIEWNIDNFDLYLDPGTAPEGFLPWLAAWFGPAFNPSWTLEQKRTLLQEAPGLYARRGTSRALSRLLEIYLGDAVEIEDTEEDLEPFTFTVRLPVKKREVDEALVEALIDANKPAHTSYSVKYRR